MNQEYEVDIFSGNTKIGELMTASASDLLKYLHKGLTVIEESTGMQITEDMLNGSLGVSDGCVCL